MGDKYFDYADLFWQNEFDLDKNMRQDALNEINIQKKDEIEKFEYFEILINDYLGIMGIKTFSRGQ